jgi:hypothetical protein
MIERALKGLGKTLQGIIKPQLKRDEVWMY